MIIYVGFLRKIQYDFNYYGNFQHKYVSLCVIPGSIIVFGCVISRSLYIYLYINLVRLNY
jgi:hypothetical protein